jgi:hypothetical protein
MKTLFKTQTLFLKLFIVTVAIGDIVNGTIGLSLAASVSGLGRVMVLRIEGTRKQRASVLSVHVMVSVDENASRDSVAQCLAVVNGIDKPVG